MQFILGALPLNLNLVEILIHLLNLTILIIAVRFLLYKPIKKFMSKRADEFKKLDDVREKKTTEAENLKQEYEELLAQTKQNVLQITESSTQAAQSRADEIINEAKQKAAKLLEDADKEIKQKVSQELDKLKLSVSDLAYSMASEILERELKEEDIDKEVNNIIGKW